MLIFNKTKLANSKSKGGITKLNSNAFTLIELLAIIVILAIIAVITVPIILNIIENSKKGAATDSAYGFKDSINKWYVSKIQNDNQFQLEGEYTVSNGKLKGGTITEEDGIDIPISGSIPSSGTLTYSNNTLTSGCLVIGDYQVIFDNGSVSSTTKGDCLIRYTIIFNTNGGSNVETQTVIAGDTIIEPEIPTKNGVFFGGWYSDSILTEQFTPSAPVIKDMTLYAKWVHKYSVSFNTNYGSTILNQDIMEGDKAARPTENPTKKGYTFVDWYTDNNYETIFDFNNNIINNYTTIYAKWEAHELTMEEMCPGCVYAYYTSKKYFKDTTGKTESEMKLDDIENKTYNYNELNKKYFLGHILDSDGKIEKAFACGFYKNPNTNEEIPFCIEGKKDGSNLYEKVELLNHEQLWNNTCTGPGPGGFYCYGEQNAKVNSGVSAYVGQDNVGGCMIAFAKGIYCDEK